MVFRAGRFQQVSSGTVAEQKLFKYAGLTETCFTLIVLMSL